jgi:hypothetical protein
MPRGISRLQSFRNRGLAHLTPQEIEKRVTFAECQSLVRSVAILAECLAPFDPDGVPLRVDEVADWSDRAGSWGTDAMLIKHGHRRKPEIEKGREELLDATADAFAELHEEVQQLKLQLAELKGELKAMREQASHNTGLIGLDGRKLGNGRDAH